MARILIVEDDPDIAALLVHYLENAGHTTARLSNGANVMRQLHGEPADLVVLDLMLPGMTGMAVCDALRADAATAHVPVIMLTARGEEADRVAGSSAARTTMSPNRSARRSSSRAWPRGCAAPRLPMPAGRTRRFSNMAGSPSTPAATG